MIEASKLKAGMTFETADGKLIRVLEASHHKPGKGNTITRMSRPRDCNSLTRTRKDSGTPGFGIGFPLVIAS